MFHFGPKRQYIDVQPEEMSVWHADQNVWAECLDGRTHRVLAIGEWDGQGTMIKTNEGETTAIIAYVIAGSELKNEQ